MKEILKSAKQAVDSAKNLINSWENEIVKYSKWKEDAIKRAALLEKEYNELLDRLGINEPEDEVV